MHAFCAAGPVPGLYSDTCLFWAPIPGASCRTTDKIASAYYFDVKDAAGNYAQYGDTPVAMRNLLASIADISQDFLQFTTPVILGGNQRYQVVVHACTGSGTKCSGDANSNLAGIGEGLGVMGGCSFSHACELLGSAMCKLKAKCLRQAHTAGRCHTPVPSAAQLMPALLR